MPSYKDDKTGKWYCSFYYTDLRGKRVRKLKRGFDLKREADKWEREFLTSEHPEKVTLDILIKDFKSYLLNQEAQGNIKHSTVYSHTKRIDLYIAPYFKDFMADKIQPKHIEEWLVKITKIEQKPLAENNRYYLDHPEKTRKVRRSSRTINSARAVLARIFDYGILNHGLKVNPVKLTVGVKKFSNDQRAKLWTLGQFSTFRSSLEREDMKVMFDTIYFSGLRIGEVLALTPSDVFPTFIRVDKGLIKLTKYDKYITTPKTDSSKRDVSIPNFLYDEIKEFLCKNPWIEPADAIFNIEEETARNHLDTKSHQLGLPIISPHILRHSYASNIIHSTNNYVIASALLGHANPNTTLRTYAHMIPDSEKVAIDALEAMNPNKQK